MPSMSRKSSQVMLRKEVLFHFLIQVLFITFLFSCLVHFFSFWPIIDIWRLVYKDSIKAAYNWRCFHKEYMNNLECIFHLNQTLVCERNNISDFAWGRSTSQWTLVCYNCTWCNSSLTQLQEVNWTLLCVWFPRHKSGQRRVLKCYRNTAGDLDSKQ